MLDSRLRLVPLPGAQGNGARFGATSPSGTPAPRALPLADMPDVMCGLLMASQAALLSIMSHGRHVQTGVPMTHLSPDMSVFMVFERISIKKVSLGCLGGAPKMRIFPASRPAGGQNPTSPNMRVRFGYKT